MTITRPDETRACVYEIVEYTRGERAAVLHDNNIGRWSYVDEDKQKFLLIPNEFDENTYNIVSIYNGDYWTIVSYDFPFFHWTVRLAEPIDNDPINKWQSFQLVFRSDLSNGSRNVFNIREFTEDEYVSCGDGGVHDGNFLRWGGDSSERSKLFSFIEFPVPKPPVSFYIHQHNSPPEQASLNSPSPTETERVTVDARILPFHAITPLSPRTRQNQFRANPYYVYRKEAFWRLGGDIAFLEYDGFSNQSRRYTIKSGIKRSEAEAMETTWKSTITWGIKGVLGSSLLWDTLKLSGEVNFRHTNEYTEKVTRSRSYEASEERVTEFDVSFTPGKRSVMAFWQLVERHSLITFSDWRTWGIISLRARSNEKLVAAYPRGEETSVSIRLRAEGNVMGDEDRYEVISNNDGTISFRSIYNKKLVSAFADNDFFLHAEGNSLGIEDKFEVFMNSDYTYSFQAKSNDLWVSAFSGNSFALRAEGRVIGVEDKFDVIIHSTVDSEVDEIIASQIPTNVLEIEGYTEP